MTENERVRKIRQDKGYTMREFGEILGIGSSTVSDIENGRRNLTASLRRLICREFGIREEWLRAGAGEMFAPVAGDSLDALAQQYGLSDEMRVLIKKLIFLKPEIQQGVVDYLLEVAEELLSSGIVPRKTLAFPGSNESEEDDVEALAEKAADLVRGQATLEEKRETPA